jgi:hypothetical protein
MLKSYLTIRGKIVFPAGTLEGFFNTVYQLNP